MIDTKLVERAKEKSKVISDIDSSWRKFVEALKDSIFTMPFKGEYSAFVKDSFVLVEGYSGPLLIDKLCYKKNTYQLKTPVRYYPFKIYGVYEQTGSFERFVAIPEIGFHYLGLSNQGHAICTGDIQYVNPDSLASLKEACLKIIKSFRVINLESLGSVLIPDEYAALRVLADKEIDAKAKLQRLQQESLVSELL